MCRGCCLSVHSLKYSPSGPKIRVRTLSRSRTRPVHPHIAARVGNVRLERKFMLPEAGLNSLTMAEIAAFDTEREPA